MATYNLDFQAKLNANNFQSGIKNMTKEVNTLGDSFKKLGQVALSVLGGVGIMATVKKSISLFAEQEQSTLKLKFAVEQFANGNKKLFKSLQDLGGQLQKNIGVGNEYVENLASIGLSVGISSDKILEATKSSILLSKALGVDANTLLRGFAQTLEGQTGLLSRYIPELRNFTEEQLKNGEAIDFIAQKFGNLENALKGTAQSSLDKLQASIGDIGEVLGKSFAPLLGIIADKMFDLANAFGEAGSILGGLKKMFVDYYNSLGIIAKGIVTFGGSFIVFSILSKAWIKTVKIFKEGSKIMVGLFKAVSSPAFLTFLGIVTVLEIFRTAWNNNWGGIQEKTMKIWNKISPIFDSIKNWFIENGSKFIKWTWDLGGKAWNWIKDTWKTVEPYIKSAFNWLWEKGKQTVSWGLNILGEGWNFLQNTWKIIEPFIKNIFSWLWDKGKQAVSWSLDILGKGWEWLKNTWQKVEPFIEKAFKWIWEKGSQAVDWGLNLVGNIWENIKTGDIVDKIANLKDKINENIQKTWKLGIEFAEKGWEWLKNVLSQEDIKSVWNLTLKPLGEAIWNLLPDWLKDKISTTWNVIANKAGKVWDSLPDVTKEQLKTTWSILTKITGAFWLSFRKITLWLMNGVEKVFELKFDVFGKMWETFLNVYNYVKDGIKNFTLNISAIIPDWVKKLYNWFLGNNSSIQKSNITTTPAGMERYYQWNPHATGYIPKFATGNIAYLDRNGVIKGEGSDTSDNILAWLSPGEAVINAKATRAYLPLLKAINSMKLPRYATGNLDGGLSGGNVGTPSSVTEAINQVVEQLTNDLNTLSNAVTGIAGQLLGIDFSQLEAQIDNLSTNKFSEMGKQLDQLNTETQKLSENFMDMEDPIQKLKNNIESMTDNPILQGASGGITDALIKKTDLGIAGGTDTMITSTIPGLETFANIMEGQINPLLSGFAQAFGILPGIGGALSGILQALIPAFSSFFGITSLIVPIVQGIFSVLSPVINSILKPLFDALRSVGQVIAVILLPAFFVLKLALLPVVAVINAVTWAFDQIILWANSLPFIGGFLSADEVKQKQRSYSQRMDEYIHPEKYAEQQNYGGVAESTMGQEFSASKTQNITYNTEIKLESVYAFDTDDKPVRQLAEKVKQIFIEEGVIPS